MDFGACVKIYPALLVALAGNYAFAVLEVDVVAVEPHEFAHAHTGRGKHVYDCEITRALAIITHDFKRLVSVGLFDRLADFNFVDAAHGALDDIVFIFEPREETRQDTAYVIDGDF